MWRSIADEKNKHRGKMAVLVGPGPSADSLPQLVARQSPDTVYIAMTRAIALSHLFEYTFIDHPHSLKIIEMHLENTRCVCMPWTSRGEVNVNDPIAQRYSDQIRLFSWVYEVPESLCAPDYPLNDVNLFVAWGCAQSAIHMAHLIGCREITLIGVDGGPVDGRIAARGVDAAFRDVDHIAKRTEAYMQTLCMIEWICQKLEMRLEFFGRNAAC